MLKGSHHSDTSRALISAKSAKAGGRRQTIFHEGHLTGRSECKECLVRQWKDYQMRNRDRINADSCRTIRYRRYDCIVYLGGVCVDCGYATHLDGLQFDHVPERGKKAFNISSNLSKAWDMLVIELDKCDLVCGTCHAIRTASRRGA